MPSSASGGLAARLAIIAMALVFGLTYSLSATLIALDLAARQVSESVIGANAAMHAVGVLAMAFLLPRMTAALGIRASVIGALVVAAAVLCLFPALPFIGLWFALRVVLGAASETLFVLSETWLNALSSDATRARTMAAYTASLSIGFALGPLILSFAGSEGFLPYGIGAGLALLAVLFIAAPGIRTPLFKRPAHTNPLRYMGLAPVAMAATALNAAVETAGLTFLGLYAISLGWAEAEATQLITWMMIGAVLLQLPIGWLGDKMNRITLIAILAGLSGLGALVWPWALQVPWLSGVLLFIWGGLFVGIYTMMLAIVGSRFSGSDIVGIYAGMGLVWGAGALLGPLLAGGAMQATAHGLVYFIALACFLFMAAVIAARSRQRRATDGPAG